MQDRQENSRAFYCTTLTLTLDQLTEGVEIQKRNQLFPPISFQQRKKKFKEEKKISSFLLFNTCMSLVKSMIFSTQRWIFSIGHHHLFLLCLRKKFNQKVGSLIQIKVQVLCTRQNFSLLISWDLCFNICGACGGHVAILLATNLVLLLFSKLPWKETRALVHLLLQFYPLAAFTRSSQNCVIWCCSAFLTQIKLIER